MKSSPYSAVRSIDREILRLALPAIVNNITVPLLGLCDTAIAGHLGSASYIGAMAVGATMLNVVYWLCGFLRMGTSGLTAQAYGAGDSSRLVGTLRQALMIGFAISVLAICLQTPLLRLFLLLISPEPQVAGPAALYFRVGIWAAPAQLGMMAVSGWFIGRQNTVVPMAVAIGVNVVNIILSLLLVFVWRQGFAGIAAGTLCAAWLGLAAILVMARKAARVPILGRGSVAETLRSPGWSRFFSVGGDLFFRSACIMGVTLAMTAVGARIGEITLAANAVVMQFFLFFSYFMDGFAFAGEALVGKAVGARDSALQRRSVAALMWWGALMAALFFLAYFFFTPSITSLLTDEQTVRKAVESMKAAVYVLPPITVAAFIFDGIFIGMARTRPLLVTTLTAASVYFGIVTGGYCVDKMFINSVLWVAFDSYLLLRGILLALVYAKYQRK